MKSAGLNVVPEDIGSEKSKLGGKRLIEERKYEFWVLFRGEGDR